MTDCRNSSALGAVDLQTEASSYWNPVRIGFYHENMNVLGEIPEAAEVVWTSDNCYPDEAPLSDALCCSTSHLPLVEKAADGDWAGWGEALWCCVDILWLLSWDLHGDSAWGFQRLKIACAADSWLSFKKIAIMESNSGLLEVKLCFFFS